MIVRELFKKELNRVIRGVIKVEQQTDDVIEQELSEYVVTHELRNHFDRFYDSYTKSLDKPTDQMGVWISGFFGSGKSHFLKILSYLLANRRVNAHSAVDLFNSKIDDPLLQANIERAAGTPTDVILFNIDTKSDADSKLNKEAIVKVFQRVFDDYAGFCGSIPWLAEIERRLWREGVWDKFRMNFEENIGQTWESCRESIYFVHEKVVPSLAFARNVSLESAQRELDQTEKDYSLSPDKFVETIKEYLSRQTKNHRIAFLVDEVGQYVGENTDLMLNLQTVVELLGSFCAGRVWVIVTSQQDIDSLTKHQVKGRDFSKIQGRFDTRLSLSSANTDEVIQRRILEKNKVGADTLSLWYADKGAILRNLISFTADTPDMINYQTEDNFVRVYPFVPYQFRLMQKIYENIRRTSAAGKHLAEGERSMLSAFQGAALSVADQEIGVLVPLSFFYNTLESFLDHTITITFTHAKDNAKLKPFDHEVLRALFMIKNLKEMPAQLENLTTLMIDSIDCDKIVLRQNIQASLERLQAQTLIQKSGEKYYFLTDEEQDVNREIKKTPVEDSDILDQVAKLVFDDIYPEKSYAYSKWNVYAFNRQVDSSSYGAQTHELTVKILTSNAEDYYQPPEMFKLKSVDNRTLLLRLPEDVPFLPEIREWIQTAKYLKQKNIAQSPEFVQRVLEDKGRENDDRYKRARAYLADAITGAEVYLSGEKVEIAKPQAKEKFAAGLQQLVKTVYTKLSYVSRPFVNVDQLSSVLKGNDLELDLQNGGDNHLALDEIRQWLDNREQMHAPVTMKFLIDRYTIRPFGWSEYDVAGLTATLFAAGQVRLQYNAAWIARQDKNVIQYLTRQSDREKLLISLRRSVGADLMEAGRLLAKDVFQKVDVPDGEDELCDTLRKLLLARQAEVKSLLARYNESVAYPGKAQLESGHAALQELLATTDSSTFLAGVQKCFPEMKDWAKQFQKIEGFFANQADKFRSAVKQLQRYEKNKLYLNTQELKESVLRIRTIIESPEPYGTIKDLPALVAQVSQTLESQLAARKAEVMLELQQLEEEIQSELTLISVDDTVSSWIERRLATLRNTLEGAEDLMAANAVKAHYPQERAEIIARIQQAKDALKSKPEVGSDQKDIDVVPRKRKRQIQASKIGGKRVLTTADDVKEYLQTLEQALTKAINDGEEVELL